jgi:GTP pyrophosphokinase
VVVRFAKCCVPVEGAPIVGIVTRGGGVSIHRPGCHNISELVVSEGRLVDAEWSSSDAPPRPVNLALRAALPPEKLAGLISKLEREVGVSIIPGRFSTRQGVSIQHLTVASADSETIDLVLSRLNGAEGVHAVRVMESA